MYEIPSLPYGYGDLEPYIDEETMRIHHSKHHQAYTDKLNMALEKYPELADKDLTGLIQQADKLLPEDIRLAIINNGGGYLNHSFFWSILAKPSDQDNQPQGSGIGSLIEQNFGSYADFKNKFKEKSLSLFGSGWTWLVLNSDNKLDIINTTNQNLPPAEVKILLGLDLWEHAYYLRYQNRRAEYVEAFFHVIDWKKIDSFLN